MRQAAPSPRMSTPLPVVGTAARPVADAAGLRASVPLATQSAAGNQPWFGRDECHCDDGPERMSQRAVRGRW
ncbi:MAG: hypothetical protein IIA02_07955 [Proteobacteria bacterium]|uniref:hypothetical protein n=1 Tax=Aquabacterium sp. TaxID=1872578 RepID=UPI0035C6B421|nr:hypothetical protein [Pseudomonadota bacterium]